jgi:DNA-binding response OmpR family regulator
MDESRRRSALGVGISPELHYDHCMAVRKTVLVVEDDPALRRMYRTVLGLAGFEVLEADDGLQALRRIDERPPDLVILDLVLPTLSGLVVQQEIAANAHTRNIPVIIVTGSDLDLGGVDVPCVMRKPVSPDKLLQAIKSCLESGPPGAGSS